MRAKKFFFMKSDFSWSSEQKVFAGQNFQLAQIFGCMEGGNVCYFDAISAVVRGFCVVQLDEFDRMPIFFGGVSERSTRTMSSEKFRVFVCEAGQAQFDELLVFRDAGWS